MLRAQNERRRAEQLLANSNNHVAHPTSTMCRTTHSVSPMRSHSTLMSWNDVVKREWSYLTHPRCWDYRPRQLIMWRLEWHRRMRMTITDIQLYHTRSRGTRRTVLRRMNQPVKRSFSRRLLESTVGQETGNEATTRATQQWTRQYTEAKTRIDS